MTKENKLNYFEELNSINVSDNVEKKNGLSYLSWAWAWTELKKRYPNAKKNVIKNDSGWLYHTDGKTCWVEVSVTINDIIDESDKIFNTIEEVEYLPIMDYKNQAIPLANVKSTDVNTSIQRAITKAIARHGLGLYIYAGEDLPEDDKQDNIANKFTKEPTGAMASLANTANEEIKSKAEEQKLNKLKESLANMGSIEEIDGYLEERGRLGVLKAMSEVNASQAMLIIKNAKLAVDPEYKGE